MKKIIVTTTINPPTKAIKKFSKLKDWKLIIVGDLKTPHNKFKKLKNVIYLNPKDQELIAKDLSDIIGWNCIQRRNIGFVLAKKLKAEIIATVDDDNIPYKNWGKNILVNRYVNANIYHDKINFFDPLSVTNYKDLWHRGFPIQLLHKRQPKLIKKKKILCLVQADLWDGDPDIDAICRIAKSPNVKFKNINNFTSSLLTPFNSQNTFISSKVLKNYFMIPGIGRMDDIWGAYYLQFKSKLKKPFIIFSKPSVYQERNNHNLFVDLEKEIIGYKNTINLTNKNFLTFLPEKSKKFIRIYQKYFKN